MDYREHRPPPALARYVECFWTATRRDAAPTLVLPDGCVDILFNSSHGLEAVGLMTAAQFHAAPSGTRYIGIRFHPGMASAFLPAPTELIDRIVPLDNLWKPAVVRQLEDRVGSASRPRTAMEALAAALVQKLPATVRVPQGHLSDRHYRRLFRETAGISPKFMQRILRFRRASEQIRGLAADPPNWAAFAAAIGYFDQAHFIREFQEFCGQTPGRYLQSLRQPGLLR